MNPDYAPHHADYPPLIEPYRGPLTAPPLPDGTDVVRLYAPDFAASANQPAAAPASSPNANKVTFWSWLGLMGSLAVTAFFFFFGNYFRGEYSIDWCPGMKGLNIEDAHGELQTFLFLMLLCLLISLWSVAKRGQAYNPSRVLGVGLLVVAFNLLVMLYVAHVLISLPNSYCF